MTSITRLKAITTALSLVFLVVCLTPVLNRSHVEGFSFTTDMNSLLYGALPLRKSDPLWPFNGEFFYLTRPAVSLLAAPFSLLAPGHGYLTLMSLVTPLYIATLLLLVQRWSDVHWPTPIIALLCFPICIEANFFANDNIVAATFFNIAALLILRREATLNHFIAGVSVSIAVLCRLDHVLLVPILGLLVLIDRTQLNPIMWRWTALGAGFLVVQIVAPLIDPGTDVLSRVQIASRGLVLWARQTTALASLWSEMLLLIQAGGLGLIVIYAGGRQLLWKTRQNRASSGKRWAVASQIQRFLPAGTLLAWPAIAYACTLGANFDPRAYLLYAPMLLVLATFALDEIRQSIARPGPLTATSAKMGGIIGAIAVAVFLLVPSLRVFIPQRALNSEGPAPFLTGRIWQIREWWEWQNNKHRLAREAANVVATAGREDGDTAIVTTYWDADRAIANALAAAGYRHGAATVPKCERAAEHWTRGAARIVHVRLHVPFLPCVAMNTAALFLERGRPCLQGIPATHRFVFRFAALWPRPEDGTLSSKYLNPASERLTDHDLIVLGNTATRLLSCKGDVGKEACCRPGTEPALRLKHADEVLSAKLPQ